MPTRMKHAAISRQEIYSILLIRLSGNTHRHFRTVLVNITLATVMRVSTVSSKTIVVQGFFLESYAWKLESNRVLQAKCSL